MTEVPGPLPFYFSVVIVNEKIWIPADLVCLLEASQSFRHQCSKTFIALLPPKVPYYRAQGELQTTCSECLGQMKDGAGEETKRTEKLFHSLVFSSSFGTRREASLVEPPERL